MHKYGIAFVKQNALIGEYFSREDVEKLEEEASVWDKKEMGDHMEVWWIKM